MWQVFLGAGSRLLVIPLSKYRQQDGLLEREGLRGHSPHPGLQRRSWDAPVPRPPCLHGGFILLALYPEGEQPSTQWSQWDQVSFHCYQSFSLSRCFPRKGNYDLYHLFQGILTQRRSWAAGAAWAVLLRGERAHWASPKLLLLLHGRFSAKGSPWAPQEFRCHCETQAPKRRSSPQSHSLVESELTLVPPCPAARAGPWCRRVELWIEGDLGSDPLTFRQVHIPQGLKFLTCKVEVF